LLSRYVGKKDNEGERMDGKRRTTRARLISAAGLLIGGLVGVATVALAGATVAPQTVPDSPPPLLEATHLPPLLTLPGEQVQLRYDVYCGKPDPLIDIPCDAEGSVFFRVGDVGAFRALPLREEPNAAAGRFVATIPRAVSRAGLGISYYAVLRSRETGAAVTLPAAGGVAPQRSLPLASSVEVSLGAHAFGSVQGASERVAEAAWGTGPGEVGLEQGGPNLTPIGASAFDVDPTGAIVLLDEANRRLLRFTGSGTPQRVPLAITGTMADLAIDDEGAVHVLEMPNATSDMPVLRTFNRAGAALGTTPLADELASQVRIGARGPVVLQSGSAQWMTVTDNGRSLTTSAQLESGRVGRPLPEGGEIVVLRKENEIRLAIVDRSGVRAAWRLLSDTPVAEVQLAEPYGSGLVVVAHVYTDDRDEYVALVLDDGGIARSFSLASAAWAESAPLSRFRLAGSSLYHLGSTPEGVFVDRFDLGVS
jgi:hypothetical protein